jgi:hypothetical protein
MQLAEKLDWKGLNITSVCLWSCLTYPADKSHLSSSVASTALQYFSTLTHNSIIFKTKKEIEHEMSVLIFSTTFA